MLVLLLAVGPLKAHAVFACEIMDVVSHDTCCCDEDETTARPDCSSSMCDASRTDPPDQQVPCCEHSATLSVDQDARQGLLTAKPADLWFDVDPPDQPVAIINACITPANDAMPAAMEFLLGVAHGPGTDTWLVTRRLRI